MRTDEELRALVDGATNENKADTRSAQQEDKTTNDNEDFAEDGDHPTNQHTAEDGDDPAGPEVELARASARRAAFRGDAQFAALRRVRRQWPKIKQADVLVVDAYAWYEERKPGRTIKIGGITKKISSLAELNEQFAKLEVRNQPACVIKRSDAMPISHRDFALRMSGTVVCLGVDDKGYPKWIDADKLWHESADKHVYRLNALREES